VKGTTNVGRTIAPKDARELVALLTESLKLEGRVALHLLDRIEALLEQSEKPLRARIDAERSRFLAEKAKTPKRFDAMARQLQVKDAKIVKLLAQIKEAREGWTAAMVEREDSLDEMKEMNKEIEELSTAMDKCRNEAATQGETIRILGEQITQRRELDRIKTEQILLGALPVKTRAAIIRQIQQQVYAITHPTERSPT
jgi:hypothetical protein